MKVTLNWLKQYVDFDWSPEELTERLTMLGLEVEGVEKVGGGFEGVVVAEVLTREKHPDADKLTVCKVTDGATERQIVCGATNFQVGDKVPLITPGHSLPAKEGEKPFTIKVGKLRGVESQGMMCSGKELGLSDDHEGLLILDKKAKVGQPLAKHLGLDEEDWVYDLEITPNRPDLNSVIGIAREISALTGNKLRLPEIHLPRTPQTPSRTEGDSAERVPPADELVSVRIDDEELCPRYTARVITGAKVGPSPNWLRNTLEKIGVRSISNVVDVTNYVMMEIGQPMHAFDYHLLEKRKGKPTIIIRRAGAAEKFTTLDEQERTLNDSMLVIADESKAVALAGVMGGFNTEIKDDTKDILIESAYFKPQNIRATSKALDLRTDSSYRFERGCDPNVTDWASRRCAQLILQTAGGQLAEGAVDVYPAPQSPSEVSLRFHKTDELLGIDIPAEEQVKYLASLELEPATRDGEKSATFRVPTFRVDLKRETDLIEEVARLYGVDRIPSTPPRGAFGSNKYDAIHDQLAEARRILSGLGLNEAQGQTLISNRSAKLACDGAVRLSHPLSSDMDVLRPSLLPGLLDSLRHNLNHKNEDVALFEIGRVFLPDAEHPREERHVAIAITGARRAPFWQPEDRNAKFDVFDLKGIVEEFLEEFGVKGLSCVREPAPTDLFVESATLRQGKHTVGRIGQLMPTLAKDYDLRDAVYLAELDFDFLLSRRRAEKSFMPIPVFPAIRRDVALMVSEETTHAAVENAVKQANLRHLESVELFDIFRGKNLSEGQKSMAYAFTYRSADKTLTDKEVDKAHEKLVAKLKQELNATIR